MKKICILASGGDAPGMNACVESVFLSASRHGFETYGAIAGYHGLVKNEIIRLAPANATNISHLTGCVLKCGRSEEFTTPAGFDTALATIRGHGFVCVVVLGGNGSMRGAQKLHASGIPVVFIPATIDNDVSFSKECLGFSSAAEESVRLVDNLNGTMQTNNRDHVVQVMGWDCPDLANFVGLATFADIVDTNAGRHSPNQVAEVFNNNRKNGKTSNLMIMQEKRSTDIVAEAQDTVNYLGTLTRAVGIGRVRMTTLGHLQRGAVPSARDRWLGNLYGEKAASLIHGGKTGLCITLAGDKITTVNIK